MAVRPTLTVCVGLRVMPTSQNKKTQQIGDGHPLLAELDRRIAAAPTSEFTALLELRTKLLAQIELEKTFAHRRQLETRVLHVKIVLSFLAFAAGVGLAVAGKQLPALVSLAAGLYGLAPSFIKRLSKWIFEWRGR